MTRSRLITFTFGLLALWPFVMLAVAIVVMEATRFDPPPSFITGWILATIVSAIGWLVFVVDAARSPRLPSQKRVLWIALLVVGGPMVMPFYFWNYVREPTTSTD